MTEGEYQSEVQPLYGELQRRVEKLVDLLVMQPPVKEARQLATIALEWAITAGAEHAEIVHERNRRRQLPKGEPR